MPNFFIKKAQIKEDKILIAGELLKHLRDSLRIQKGEKIICIDEDGNRYHVVITSIGKDSLRGDVAERVGRKPLPAFYIHIAQAIPKGPKLDFIIQKSTELGVNAITPLLSERTIVRVEKERVNEKVERWRRIAIEAAQQSNRIDVPEIVPPLTLSDFLSSFRRADLNLLLWEREKRQGIRRVLREVHGIRSIAILIGPEGGFSENEVGEAIASGFTPVSLGGLTVRTETASIVVLSILQYEFGYIGCPDPNGANFLK